MTGGSKRKSAAWRESGQQGGRLTRKQKQELAAGGEFHEELIAGLEVRQDCLGAAAFQDVQ